MTKQELHDAVRSGRDLSGTMFYPEYPIDPLVLEHVNQLLKHQFP